MNHIHLEKKGLRGLAIAESFKQGDSVSRLGGVVIRRDFIIDGFVFGECTVEGDDATDVILDMYSRLNRDDINYIIISGLVISMYNIVDIKKIWEKTKIPIIGVTYEESGGIEDAIRHHFPNSYTPKLEQYYKLGKRTEITLHTGYKLYLRNEGCILEEAKKFLDLLTVQGSVPEPVRVAQLLAKASSSLKKNNLITFSCQLDIMDSQLSFGAFDSKRHLMVAYDDVAMGHKIEFQFIKEGLDKNELSIYCTHDDVKTIEKEMLSFGIDVHYYKKKKMLNIINLGNPAEGSLDFMDSVQTTLQNILPNPRISFRIVGRAIPDVGTETAMAVQARWETILHNVIFDKLNGSILCTYDLFQIKANNEWVKWLTMLQKNHHAYIICKNGKSNLTVNQHSF